VITLADSVLVTKIVPLLVIVTGYVVVVVVVVTEDCI
jgi:hypothetical protein